MYSALSQVMSVLKEIGIPQVSVWNGSHLFEGREPAPCDPIPPDIFKEFSGRLEMWTKDYLMPTLTSTPARTPATVTA